MPCGLGLGCKAGRRALHRLKTWRVDENCRETRVGGAGGRVTGTCRKAAVLVVKGARGGLRGIFHADKSRRIERNLEGHHSATAP